MGSAWKQNSVLSSRARGDKKRRERSERLPIRAVRGGIVTSVNTSVNQGFNRSVGNAATVILDRRERESTIRWYKTP